MGQGNYIMIGYGVILEKPHYEIVKDEEFDDILFKYKIRTSYESDSHYLSIDVMDFGFGMLDKSISASFKLSSLKEEIEKQVDITKIEKKWSKFSEIVSEKFKIDLGQPELLIINDYD
jgi:hypothetical protein